jgi:hypothetical protein
MDENHMVVWGEPESSSASMNHLSREEAMSLFRGKTFNPQCLYAHVLHYERGEPAEHKGWVLVSSYVGGGS